MVNVHELVGCKLAGRYHVLRSLARGGMGAVYEALDEKLHRRVAVKVIRSEFLQDSVSIERFKREAFATAQVSHPSLVSILDVSLESDPMFFVLELIDGPTLDAVLSQAGVLHWQRAIRIASDVLSALQVLHDASIIHRDVKPSNLVLTRNGARESVKLIDLGVAKLSMDPESDQLTWTGNVVGTPAYMAPEQYAGKSVNHQADLYSVGVVLAKMIFGKDHPSILSLADDSAALSWPGDVPTELRSILRSLLQPLPEDRPSSAKAVVHRLAPWMDAEPSPLLEREPESSYGGYSGAVSESHVRSVQPTTVSAVKPVQPTTVSAVKPSQPVASTTLKPPEKTQGISKGVLLIVGVSVLGAVLTAVAVKARQKPASRPPTVPSTATVTQQPSMLPIEVPSPSGLGASLTFSYGGQNLTETERNVAPQIEPGLRQCIQTGAHALGQQVVAVDVYVNPLGKPSRIEWHESRSADRGSPDEVECVEAVLRRARWTPYSGVYSTSVIALLL